MNDKKLGKIVQLAKHGTDGEKRSAMLIVERICREQNLDVTKVMADAEPLQWYEFKYQSEKEVPLMAGVCCKLVGNIQMLQHKKAKLVRFQLTPAQMVDVEYAMKIYMRAYRSERRKAIKAATEDLPMAFTIKHALYMPGGEGKRPPTWEEELAIRRGMLAAQGLGDVSIHKPIMARSQEQ